MEAYRFIPVVLLLGVAAAFLTDYSKLPISVRGLGRLLGKRTGGATHKVAPWRRFVAFVLIIAAFFIAVG